MSDLVNRLRGIYTIPVNDGAGLLDGKDTFTRKFDNLPPIQAEAANELERVYALVEQLRQVVSDVVKWNEAYNEPLCGPIALIDRARAALAATKEPKA